MGRSHQYFFPGTASQGKLRLYLGGPLPKFQVARRGGCLGPSILWGALWQGDPGELTQDGPWSAEPVLG